MEKWSVFMCSNMICAACPGSMIWGMLKSFLSVRRVLMKPGLQSCTSTPVPRRSQYIDSASDIVPAFEAQ